MCAGRRFVRPPCGDGSGAMSQGPKSNDRASSGGEALREPREGQRAQPSEEQRAEPAEGSAQDSRRSAEDFGGRSGLLKILRIEADLDQSAHNRASARTEAGGPLMET